MSPLPQRATERLHLGRVSSPGAIYFVTFVTAERTAWLGTESARAAMIATLRDWHTESDGEILIATVMPDHVHVLFKLGRRLDVGRCVSRWKSRARKAESYSGAWLRDFWEHQVRDGESTEDYALYIFLNPYRARLLPCDATWPGSWMPDPARFRFTSLLGPSGAPPREWIDWPDERFAGLATGE